jgi:uncharacterized repeat protein (TIGR01451 family)
MKLNDVVWSQQDAAAGEAEAFGANVVLPADSAVAPVSEFAAASLLSIAVVVDAVAVLVSTDIIDNDGTAVASGIVLFDDGTHGDAVVGDRIWSNDGSDAVFPTYTVALSDPPGNAWLIRAYAFDASPAGGSSLDGLLLRPGQPATPEIQNNYFNVDEQSFVVGGAVLSLPKTAAPLQDPIGGSQPKSLPGSWVGYEVAVTNLGPDVAAAVVLVDNVAADVSYSLDGVDYTYSPMPDADGFDTDIRFIRIAPGGSFNAPVGADNAEFLIRYVVRVD